MDSDKGRISKKSKRIWVLLIIGFCAMEIPGVLFFGGKVRPFLFGMPFLYGYILCWWAYMLAVFFYAYRCDWGRRTTTNDG